MSPRARIWVLVTAIAVTAAGVTVGTTLLTRTGTGGDSNAAPAVRKGPLELDVDLGVRTDPEAVALRRALSLYGKGQRKAARAIFVRYRSLEAEIGVAAADWPSSFDRLASLAHDHPRSSLAQLELGLAFFQQGRVGQAEGQWRKARRVQPDTSAAVRAEDLLYPRYFRGHPPFSPSFSLPPRVAKLSSPKLLAYLEARAGGRDSRAKLFYGAALLQLGRTVSAEREFQAAAALAPNDADARVAAAVGLFDKASPSRAFSKLGPLVRVFPKAVTVRFHLGLMLLWIGQAKAGKAQLDRVVAAGPSPFAADATKLLRALGGK